MLHVGNDIVDLREPSNRGQSRNSRFLNRVFSSEEQEAIRTAAQPDAILWALWAAKEAAYKLVSKTRPGINAIPRRYVAVLGIERATAAGHDAQGRHALLLPGRIKTPAGEVAVAVTITADYVHCLATRTAADRTLVREHLVTLAPGEDQAGALRREALAIIARMLACPPADLTIRRFPAPRGLGPPLVFCGKVAAPLDLSLSHDGGFGALALAVSSAAISTALRPMADLRGSDLQGDKRAKLQPLALR